MLLLLTTPAMLRLVPFCELIKAEMIGGDCYSAVDDNDDSDDDDDDDTDGDDDDDNNDDDDDDNDDSDSL